MKTLNLEKVLCLHASEGWQFNSLTEGNKKTFYNHIIESNDLCIAWVAVRETITPADLIKHHFVREENLGTGENNFNPRLLIVTDGKVLFVSRIGSKKFVKTSFGSVLMVMAENLKSVLAYYKQTGIYSMSLNKLNTTIEKQKTRIRFLGEAEGEKQLTLEDKLFETKSPNWDDETNFKNIHEVGKMKIKALENILKMKTAEAGDMSIMLHYMLCNTFNAKQLREIQSFTEQYIYINPWYNKNQLLVKVSDQNLFGVQKKGSINNRFYIVDAAGNIETIYIEPENALEQLTPGFLRLDKVLLKQLLKNKYHE